MSLAALAAWTARLALPRTAKLFLPMPIRSGDAPARRFQLTRQRGRVGFPPQQHGTARVPACGEVTRQVAGGFLSLAVLSLVALVSAALPARAITTSKA